MKLLWSLRSISVVFVIASSSSPAPAQELRACDGVLALKNTNVKTFSRRAQFAWLKLLSKDDFHSHEQEISAIVPGYFSGNLNTFDEERSKLFSQENYTSSVDEAATELSIEVPADVVSSWTLCAIANSKGLFASLKNVDKDGATLVVSWSPAPGLGPLSKVIADIHGIQPSKPLDALTDLSIGDHPFVLDRASENKTIRGTITGVAGANGAYAIEIYIPGIQPPAPPPPLKTRQLKPVESAVGMRWEPQKASPEKLLPAGPSFVPVGLTLREDVCVESSPGWALVRDTISISPNQVSPGCFILCKESKTSDSVPISDAKSCSGKPQEHKICFSGRMSVNRGESCSWSTYKITGEEIEERP
jgi:hypothetical protein